MPRRTPCAARLAAGRVTWWCQSQVYRSDRSGHIPGTGLGLPLVKEIMKLHGGSVSLESTPDIGTCVTLWFPVAAQGTAATRSGLAAP